MKKLLLSMALAAAVVAPAAADDYVLYIGTKAENGAVTNYLPVNEGDIITAIPNFHGEDLECAAFVKVANNTAAEATGTINVTKLAENNVYGNAFVLFQACIGGICQDPPVTFTVPANGETEGGTAEHIGYSAMGVTAQEAEAIKFDARYAASFTIGNFTRNFTILYKDSDTSVGSISAADATPEYFNLQGIRVASPVKGEVYIVRQGAAVTKTLMR